MRCVMGGVAWVVYSGLRMVDDGDGQILFEAVDGLKENWTLRLSGVSKILCVADRVWK